MKVVQIMKQLNNTELGKTGTNDSYVQIPNDLDVSCVFEMSGTNIEFTDKFTGETVLARNTVGREKRVVGLGQYYRNNGLNAGDEIVFEKQIMGDRVKYYIYTHKKEGSLVVQKTRHGFEILTPERIDLFKQEIASIETEVELIFLKSEKKRSDSPILTDFYDIQISGNSLRNKDEKNKFFEIEIVDGDILVTGFYGWKKYLFEMEDEG